MPAPILLNTRAEIVIRKQMGEGTMEIARDLSLDPNTVIKYWKDFSKEGQEAFQSLVTAIKERRISEWVALSAMARWRAGEALPDLDIRNTTDLRNAIWAAGVSEDKTALLENRLPGQGQPPSLAVFLGTQNNYSGNDVPQLSETEIRNHAMQGLARQKLERERQLASESLDREDEPQE